MIGQQAWGQEDYSSAEVPAKTPRFQRSIDSQILERYLYEHGEVGTFVPYSVLSEQIGKDVQKTCKGGAYQALHSARWRLLREKGILFTPIQGQGLQSQPDVGKISTVDQNLSTIYRKGNKNTVLLKKTDFPALPPQEKDRFISAQLRNEIVVKAGSASMKNKINNLIDANQDKLRSGVDVSSLIPGLLE